MWKRSASRHCATSRLYPFSMFRELFRLILASIRRLRLTSAVSG